MEWKVAKLISSDQTSIKTQSIFLLSIRVIWGFSFILAGVQKLRNLPLTIAYFEKIGVPFPDFSSHLVALVESFGGSLILLGLFTRISSLFLIINMFCAFYFAYPETFKSIFIKPESFFTKAPFSFLFTSWTVFIFGSGHFSLDKIWSFRKRK